MGQCNVIINVYFSLTTQGRHDDGVLAVADAKNFRCLIFGSFLSHFGQISGKTFRHSAETWNETGTTSVKMVVLLHLQIFTDIPTGNDCETGLH